MTIATIGSLSDEMPLIDMNGYSHEMSSGFVDKVLILGWVFFLLATLSNILYYVVHPMAPQVNPKNKLKTYLVGHLVPKENDIEIQALIVGENSASREEEIPLAATYV